MRGSLFLIGLQHTEHATPHVSNSWPCCCTSLYFCVYTDVLFIPEKDKFYCLSIKFQIGNKTSAIWKSFCVWGFLWELQVPLNFWCHVFLPVLHLLPSFPSQEDTGLTWSFQFQHSFHFYVLFLTLTVGSRFLQAASWVEDHWENGSQGSRRHLGMLQAVMPAQLVRSPEAL